MATVSNTIKLPDGTTPLSARVEIELVASETAGATEAGWITASDITVLSTARPTVTNGAWTADLTPNANIDPSGTVYRVNEYVGRDRYTHYIEVGAGGGSLHDLLAEAPTALTPQWLAALGQRTVVSVEDAGLVALEQLDSAGIGSWTDTGWYDPDPAPMRLRVTRPAPDEGGGQHFQILPYEFGMAIEYPGNVECFTEAWSLHVNRELHTVNDYGAVLWVGNNDDTGGLRLTATNYSGTLHGDIYCEKFNGTSNGPLRFIVRGTSDGFQFRRGAYGADATIAEILPSGAVRPGTTTTAARPSLASGDAGAVLFDSDLDRLIVWDGTAWAVLGAPSRSVSQPTSVSFAINGSGSVATSTFTAPSRANMLVVTPTTSGYVQAQFATISIPTGCAELTMYYRLAAGSNISNPAAYLLWTGGPSQYFGTERVIVGGSLETMWRVSAPVPTGVASVLPAVEWTAGSTAETLLVDSITVEFGY